MPDNELDVAALGDDELAQLIQDCNSELQMRVAVGWPQRREPAKGWRALSYRNLRALRQEVRRERLSRGIVTIPAEPLDAQEMFSTMIAAAHRGVAELYLSAAILTPKPEQKGAAGGALNPTPDPTATSTPKPEQAAPDAKTEVVEPKADAEQKSGEEQQATPDTVPVPVALPTQKEPQTGAAMAPASLPGPRPIERGKFCDQVIDELKRIKNLSRGTGRGMAEIHHEYPDLAAWKVREVLSPEDQETFNHPNRWGGVVG